MTSEQWVGTFSRQHYHPTTGQNLRFGYVVFEASSSDDAMALLRDTFGKDWWDVHAMTDEIRKQLSEPPRYRVGWPMPATIVGETVTLRLRITPALAKESILWAAGRCVVHRPIPDCIVFYGAGVWPEDGEYPNAWRNHKSEPGVGGAGLTLLIRFVRREDAERAVAKDPENLSIVAGSESVGTLRALPHDEPNKFKLSGVLTIEAIDSLAQADKAFWPLQSAAMRAVEQTGEDEARCHAIEFRDGEIVGVHIATKQVW